MKTDSKRVPSRRPLRSTCVYAGLFIAFACSGGCQAVSGLGSRARNVVDYFSGKTALNAARRMEDSYFPDERREGMLSLADRGFGLREPYTRRYQQIASSDSDWLVRATAIRTLNRARDTSATPVFIKALGDENPIVRTEAAKALNNMPDEQAVQPLLKLVQDLNQDRDVRIWSAAALHHYRTLPVARALASLLDGREFGVAWESRRSLIALTGKDLSFEKDAWVEYLNSNQNPFG